MYSLYLIRTHAILHPYDTLRLLDTLLLQVKSALYIVVRPRNKFGGVLLPKYVRGRGPQCVDMSLDPQIMLQLLATYQNRDCDGWPIPSVPEAEDQIVWTTATSTT